VLLGSPDRIPRIPFGFDASFREKLRRRGARQAPAT
jgi:hypothetical protein